jgi:hypothetical protein
MCQPTFEETLKAGSPHTLKKEKQHEFMKEAIFNRAMENTKPAVEICGSLTISWDSCGRVTASGWTKQPPQGVIKKAIGRVMLRWLKGLYQLNTWNYMHTALETHEPSPFTTGY